MLPFPHRLRSSRDFSRAVRRGRRAGGGSLIVHLLVPPPDDGDSGAGAEPARVGLVVGRAVGTAVGRNRVKRRLRHALSERLDRLPAGSILVVRALPAAADRSYVELSSDLDRPLDRLLSPAVVR